MILRVPGRVDRGRDVVADAGQDFGTVFTTGTLNTNTFTFGCMLLGTVLLLAALLFIPAGVLGPVAEHYGPLPFGG